jgi:hypothetical protein
VILAGSAGEETALRYHDLSLLALEMLPPAGKVFYECVGVRETSYLSEFSKMQRILYAVSSGHYARGRGESRKRR